MKKVLSILIFCMAFSLNSFSRGGFHSSSHSFHSSGTSTHSRYGRPTTHTVGSSVHTNSVRTNHSESGFHHSPRPITFYRNNPSYRMVNNHYYPVYYRSPNYLFWYFVLFNHRTHRNDTIHAKSKEELDKKVKSVDTSW